mmetsp:Transcript_10039/g.41391  ORF Transcript_10039/g.41391 Transcript_10039/m.41391 type:complete len:290 (+) Transcript_10039:925-1794(+)
MSTTPSAVATAARAIPRRGSTSTRVGAPPCPARATYTVLRRSSSPPAFEVAFFPDTRFPPRVSAGIIVCRPGATTTKPRGVPRALAPGWDEEPRSFAKGTTSAPAGSFAMRSKPLAATGKGHPLATTSDARTSTRIGAGPDRAPCVAHAGSHVTASRMRVSEEEVSEEETSEEEVSEKASADDDETRSSRTTGDRSVARPTGTVSLTGTVPRHLAKAKGTRRGDPDSPSPIAASRGSRRSRSGDVGSTPRTGSLTPALTIPRAATAPSVASMTSYSQSHGNAVCMDSGG